MYPVTALATVRPEAEQSLSSKEYRDWVEERSESAGPPRARPEARHSYQCVAPRKNSKLAVSSRANDRFIPADSFVAVQTRRFPPSHSLAVECGKRDVLPRASVRFR